ncbi:MAG: 5-(carboxyamino)imidazole ribonucleotide synthase [Gammaproteobacteria bacterium 39-13]|jgi:5-(carboxyamino)imidazole ribonucleotide synthase|nr:5-(carboxyamino)imidazole ribonucleotide synthase [Gammaproteobacteria bacterium]OJV91676.1 MAG: 5-(carboxyamino)imidazole ribonucleotide synthase [Gammaproteobacteria bacterium 39-13]
MKIGIIGAGQLSRMLALSAIYMGFEFVFYDQKQTKSITNLGDFMNGSYSDLESLAHFANTCDVITFENENIPYESIEFLESLKPVYPNSKSLKYTQDKMLEKKLFDKLAIPTPSYQIINTVSDAVQFAKKYGYPFLIKKRKNGYDGKGLTKVNTEDQLLTISDDVFCESICEQYVKFDREISIIAVNTMSGERRYYDICENSHKEGILIKTSNKPEDSNFSKAKEYIDLVIDDLGYVGCISFEFFQKGNLLLANEIAPRVHNSGHWTIEGAFTSQFENHIRAIAGLPLGNTASRGNATMFNIIGEMVDMNEALNKDLSYFHDYKKESMPGRKLGHITMLE